MKEVDEQKIILSQDVIIDILKRLPAKPLIRFKCVSKTWYNLISSPDFISIHYSCESLSDHFILFKRYIDTDPEAEDNMCNRGKNMLSIHSNDDSFKSRKPTIECFDNYIGVTLAGPCNGIVIIASYRYIVLYNPTLRELFELPPSILPPPPYLSPCNTIDYWMRMTMGIGFDIKTNDYKVVRILDPTHEYECEDFENYYKDVSKVEVYNLSTNSWRRIEDLKGTLDPCHCSHLHYNGTSHWIGSMAVRNDYYITYFNFNSETFHEIPFPLDLASEERKSLAILNKCLALVCYTTNYHEDEAVPYPIDIWVMKKYGVRESWIKEFTVEPIIIETPLSVWNNDTELMIETNKGELVSCNLLSQATKDLDMAGIAKSLQAVVCKESLISIKKEREKWS